MLTFAPVWKARFISAFSLLAVPHCIHRSGLLDAFEVCCGGDGVQDDTKPVKPALGCYAYLYGYIRTPRISRVQATVIPLRIISRAAALAISSKREQMAPGKRSPFLAAVLLNEHFQ